MKDQEEMKKVSNSNSSKEIELKEGKYYQLGNEHAEFENKASEEKQASDQDLKLASYYFVFLGLASLLPWNTVLSTLDYYDKQFPDGKVTFYFPAALTTTIILTKLFIVYFKEIFSINLRVAGSLFVQAFLLAIFPIIAYIFSGSNIGYWIAMLFLIILGTINQVSYASSMGLAGYFPSQFMSNFTTGTGLGGITTNLLRIATLLFIRTFASQSSLFDIFIQYASTTSFLVFCAYLHLKFVKSDYAIQQIEKHTVLDFSKKSGESKNHAEELKASLQRLWSTFRKVQTLALFMILIYIQTLMLFPGVMLKQEIPNLDLSWKVVLLQATYNISDTIGKHLTHHVLLDRKAIFKLIFCRFIFYFTFITQAVTSGAPIIDDVWFTILNIVLFGVSNGFTTSAIFIFGPQEFEGEDKEIVIFLLLNCLSFGIMLGSFMAIPLADI